jgi:23S rRNA pseudouridine1911/1915/1917 synthase
MTELRWVVGLDQAGMRLDKFLAEPGRLGSRGRASDALVRGKVFVNDAEAGPRDASRRLQSGDRILAWLDRPGSARRRIRRPERAGDLAIVFEDDALIVVNKPPGLLAVPLERKKEALSVADVLAVHLRSRGKRRPLTVHRIDRDTSGLVVFATRPDIQARLREQFRRHEPERFYLAILYGHPNPPTGTWRDRLVWDQRSLIQKATHDRDKRGRDAQTDYRVIEALRGASLVEFRLHTGRRNQIRLQASLHGHVLVGEERYVEGIDGLQLIPFHRQALHACRLAFCHPVTGQLQRFEAPLPADMEELLTRLRGGRGNHRPSTAV